MRAQDDDGHYEDLGHHGNLSSCAGDRRRGRAQGKPRSETRRRGDHRQPRGFAGDHDDCCDDHDDHGDHDIYYDDHDDHDDYSFSS